MSEQERRRMSDDLRKVPPAWEPAVISLVNDMQLSREQAREAVFWVYGALNAAGWALVPVEIIDLVHRALKFYERSWGGHPGNSGPGGIDPQEPEIEPNQELCEDGGECARIALGMLIAALEAATARQQGEGVG